MPFLREANHGVRCPTTLRVPCCEEVQATCGKMLCRERETQPASVRVVRAQPPRKSKAIFGHSRPTRFNQEKSWGNKSTARTKAPSVYCTYNYSSHWSQSSSHHGTDTSHSHRALPEFLLSVAGLRTCLVFYCPRYGGGLLHSRAFENLM